MKKYGFILYIYVLLFSEICTAQGLKFNSAELPIDKRTSYQVIDPPPAFSDRFELSFDMRLYPITEIGYVLRIKNEGTQKIYNLFYDGRGDNFFKLNEEGKCTLIIAKIDREALLAAPWFRVSLAFDLNGDSITLTIHDRSFTVTDVGLPDTYHPVFVFGKSDYIIDVPSFAIRNLTVKNDKSRYTFALNQNEGEVVHDARRRATGRVLNPEWLINDAYHWRYRTTFSSLQAAGANYNSSRREVYYFNRDTLFTYNVRSEQSETTLFEGRCPVELILGMNFLDTLHHKLYTYEVYDDVPPMDGPAVASLDLNTHRWQIESYQHLPTQLHHHGAYFDADSNRYTIYGGFGNMRFSKDFCTYDLKENSWHVMDTPSGDVLFPRYFSSVGYLRAQKSLYIFGGMGNESGEQTVGRYYFYDLHRLDLSTGRMQKLWEIPWPKMNSVPVRGMIVPDSNYFYTLCYPESVSDSYLRLYKFSIHDGSYEILGDSIPIHSDKIATNANLYYDEQQQYMFALVQEFDDDIKSRLKIYSLAFPPISAEQLAAYARTSGAGWRWIYLAFLGGAFILLFAVWGYKRLRRRFLSDEPHSRQRKNRSESNFVHRPNAVYLFGDFMVRDRQNRDITYLFTTQLKQIFCLILQNSQTDGISSSRLSNLIWPDKAEDRVKNSRGVALNHLRRTLGELDGVELVYNKGCFKLVLGEAFYCDYMRCMELIASSRHDEQIGELALIVSRGKFLKASDQPLFDSFKESVESRLEPILQADMEHLFAAEDFTATLALAECVFSIDPLNDNALSLAIRSLNKLKRSEEARARYQTFAAEYKKTFGVEYPQSFRIF